MVSDDWSHDPSVCFMRRVFKNMEDVQKDLMATLNISLFDMRLRGWRDEARDLFEQVWSSAMRQGVISTEEESRVLYCHCLAWVLRSEGIVISDRAFPQDEKLSKMIQEVLR